MTEVHFDISLTEFSIYCQMKKDLYEFITDSKTFANVDILRKKTYFSRVQKEGMRYRRYFSQFLKFFDDVSYFTHKDSLSLKL